jgi:hypothetical protein
MQKQILRDRERKAFSFKQKNIPKMIDLLWWCWDCERGFVVVVVAVVAVVVVVVLLLSACVVVFQLLHISDRRWMFGLTFEGQSDNGKGDIFWCLSKLYINQIVNECYLVNKCSV